MIEVDMDEIDELLDNATDGEERLRYIDAEFEPLIAEAYIAIGSPAIKLETAWTIFRQLIEYMHGDENMDSP